MPCQTRLPEGAPPTFVINIAPSPQNVRSALASVMDWLGRNHLPEVQCGSAEIVLAEALNNIVEHGGMTANHSIRLTLHLTNDGVECWLHDFGKKSTAMLDSGHAWPETSCATASLPEGGFGISLIHALAVDIRYVPVTSGNLLRLTVPLTTDSAQIY